MNIVFSAQESNMLNQNIITPRLLTLVDYHHPILRKVTQTVRFPLSEEDKQLIEDMKYSIQGDQLEKAKAPFHSAAGMAANQWGFNKRIFIFCPTGEDELEVIINPSYEIISQDSFDEDKHIDLKWEGCFSVPLATGHVKRYTTIRVQYQNEDGEKFEKELRHKFARVWQHENDHLDGLLYDDIKSGKCIDKREFSTNTDLEKFYAAKKAEQK